MGKVSAGQGRIPGTTPARIMGRVRRAVAREIADARARGVDVSPASVTVVYVIADQLDLVDRTNEDRYLLPQLAARLLEERRAAHLLPDPPPPGEDDVWSQFAADLAAMGDGPPA